MGENKILFGGWGWSGVGDGGGVGMGVGVRNSDEQ